MKLRFCAAALVFALSACGGGGGGSNGQQTSAPPPQAAAEITLSGAPALMFTGDGPVSIQSRLSAAGTVSWSLETGSPGSLSAATGETVNYLPPAARQAATTVTVVATSGSSRKTISFKLYPNPGAAGISIVAGASGSKDVIDGVGTAARFQSITNMTPDSQGNVWLIDGNALRLLQPDGSVRTLKDFAQRSDDGLATGYFPSMKGVALARDGSPLLLWWWQGSTISSVDSHGALHDIVKFPDQRPPLGMVDRGNGQFYLLYANHIHSVSTTGSSVLLAGRQDQPGKTDGNGADARFEGIQDAALAADGTLVVADLNGVRRVQPNGTVSTLHSTAVALDRPRSVARDNNGNVLILNRGAADAYTISVMLAGGEIRPVLQAQDPSIGGKAALMRLTSNNQLILGAGSRADIVAGDRVVPLAGLEDDTTVAVDGPAASARFQRPSALAADAAGNLYVLDRQYDPADAARLTTHLVVRKITPEGQVSTMIDQSMGDPAGLAAAPSGSVYVAIRPTGRLLPQGPAIYRVNATGPLELVAGQPLAAPSLRDGAGIEARFADPVVQNVAADGSVIVSDYDKEKQNAVWRKVSPAGLVTTLPDGKDAIKLAWDGLQYTVNLNNQIVRINADGSTTVITNGGYGASAPGPLPGRLTPAGLPVPYGPYALAVIGGNTIYKVVLPH